MYVTEGSGFCFEYACVRKKVCRYSLSVKKMKGREQKVVFMRESPSAFKREIERKERSEDERRGEERRGRDFHHVSIKLFHISLVSTVQD